MVTQTRVKSCYKAVFCGRKYRRQRKENLSLPEAIIADVNDKDDVWYMFNTYLTDPGVKIYLIYNDGTSVRIKSRRLFLTVP